MRWLSDMETPFDAHLRHWAAIMPRRGQSRSGEAVEKFTEAARRKGGRTGAERFSACRDRQHRFGPRRELRSVEAAWQNQVVERLYVDRDVVERDIHPSTGVSTIVRDEDDLDRTVGGPFENRSPFAGSELQKSSPQEPAILRERSPAPSSAKSVSEFPQAPASGI